ncbi:MAG TPA: RraA family protein [Stellaceae bacterium]|jgi:regulator of RNase E activity RraA|nr:RraA family protein [Stellaceae bacterium]
MTDSDISPDLLAKLAGFDTPTICNALEIVAPERRGFGFTVEPLQCLYPSLKPIVGFARTATLRSVQRQEIAPAEARKQRLAYYQYIAEGGLKPSISIVQDLDGARAGFGSFWGEVNSHIHKGLGGLGVITDGSVRDVDANAAGFQMLCRMVVPSHAHVHIVDFGGTVTVAGMYVASGDLVHADRHGAVVIPHAVAGKIDEAARLIARREAVLIGASKEPGFDFARLRKAFGDANEIH